MKAPSKALLDLFDRFWSAYPKRPENPRAPARAVFVKLFEAGEDMPAVVGAARRYAEACRAAKKDPQFIPHARKWLHQRHFEDYLIDADAPASAQATGPSPDHPFAFMAAEIGEAAWRSYLALVQVDDGPAGLIATVPTAFARDHIAKAGWAAQIEAELGEIDWRVRRST